ncbi:glycine-rich protein 3 short isoform [Cajanus cajan]|uniref:Glycine-rich protein n=1 Tax=Cajanus cajan TaxID=3821 RepID=A0A151RHT0_CAJCA|nr:glycine-rich protein 3 short isoform [Cajanus cajan]KYP41985.1 hypothetical protein KK1_036601 [Cajanus cajan]
MGSKALLVLLVLFASVLLLSADVASKDAPKDVDEEVDTSDGNFDTNGVEEMKHHRGSRRGHGSWHHGHGGWRRGHGGWRRGHGGGYYCPYGCCGWNYYGRCWRCCHYPGELVDAHNDVEPLN